MITEFMASNSTALEDEDPDKPGWIEIYNGQIAAVNAKTGGLHQRRQVIATIHDSVKLARMVLRSLNGC